MTTPDQLRLVLALERIAEALESIAMAVLDLAETTRPAPAASSAGPERGPPDAAA
jgi:hypothetical protein